MKPEHRLIGIIGAMDSELETLLAAMTEKKQETLYGLTFTTGTLDGCAVVLVKAGIGKVNAARCTQLLINRFSPSAIVNTGIAGGLAPGLSVGDVVVATGVLQHDFDVTAFGHAKGYLCTGGDDTAATVFPADEALSGCFAAAAQAILGEGHVHRGLIATGDQFISGAQIRALQRVPRDGRRNGGRRDRAGRGHGRRSLRGDPLHLRSCGRDSRRFLRYL